MCRAVEREGVRRVQRHVWSKKQNRLESRLAPFRSTGQQRHLHGAVGDEHAARPAVKNPDLVRDGWGRRIRICVGRDVGEGGDGVGGGHFGLKERTGLARIYIPRISDPLSPIETPNGDQETPSPNGNSPCC